MHHNEADGNDYPVCGQCEIEAPPSLIDRSITNAMYERNRHGGY